MELIISSSIYLGQNASIKPDIEKLFMLESKSIPALITEDSQLSNEAGQNGSVRAKLGLILILI